MVDLTGFRYRILGLDSKRGKTRIKSAKSTRVWRQNPHRRELASFFRDFAEAAL
jgi:hypothetical protein